MKVRGLPAAVLSVFLFGCLGPLGTPQKTVPPASSAPPLFRGPGALIPLNATEIPLFHDDADMAALQAALAQSVGWYRAQPSDRRFAFGPRTFSPGELADAYEGLLSGAARPEEWAERIRRDFTVYVSRGSDENRTVVFSAYYEHELPGSLVRTKRFRYPLYGRPGDLEEVRTAEGGRKVQRVAGNRRVDYFTRKEIDSHGALRGRGLEIAWADDPAHVFFLQVQGSGWLRLPDGSRLRLRYAGNNGHPYRSVGGHMIESGLLSREAFSRESMVAYLSKHSGERQGILNFNPRYVFFQIDRGPQKEKAFGSLNVPLTPMRSVATDPALFPPGALAWMETSGKYPAARFVVSQDEGGAIKGPARVDYFVGAGEEAERLAVRIWEKGRLYFFAPRRGGTEDGGR